VFGVAHVKFERARSIHLQASNHRGPAAAGASPVSVLTSTQQGATASRADRQIFPRSTDSPAPEKKKKTRSSRTTDSSRVASPAYSFGPGVATATRSRAAPRSTTRPPTQTCYIKKKKKKTERAFTSVPLAWPRPLFQRSPPLCTSPAYRCPSRPWPPSGRPAPAAAAARVPSRPALTVSAFVSARSVKL
jgi:hypothetical protein